MSKPGDKFKHMLRRFMREIYRPNIDSCVEWTKSKNDDGYGIFWSGEDGRMIGAHRIMYEIFHGEIEDGLCVLHSCDNPSCINPFYLRKGTHTENMADKKQKCRARGRVQLKGEFSPYSKLNGEKIRQIRRLLAEGKTCKEVGVIFGVSGSLISMVKTHKIWAHIKGV